MTKAPDGQRSPAAAAVPGQATAPVQIYGIAGIPEISPGADLAGLIADAATAPGGPGLLDGDILVVTSKVVSKAEGRVTAMSREDAIAAETVRVVARRGPMTISQTRHGLVMAAAGVDESNTAPGTVVLLPEDPDESARRLRKALRGRPGVNVGVVVTDTFGRPWRAGQTDTAIGAAGVVPVRDHRGEADAWGNTLDVTMAAVADEIAAAGDLVKGKALQLPVALVRGLSALVTEEDGPGARVLVRPSSEDMFRLGAADVLPARRTVRAFTAQRVDPAAVERAIGAAVTAPAPHHSEPWRFVIVSSLTAKLALLDAMQDAWVSDLRRDGFTEEQIARRLKRGEPLQGRPADRRPLPGAVGDARLPGRTPDPRRTGDVRGLDGRGRGEPPGRLGGGEPRLGVDLVGPVLPGRRGGRPRPARGLAPHGRGRHRPPGRPSAPAPPARPSSLHLDPIDPPNAGDTAPADSGDRSYSYESVIQPRRWRWRS